MANGGQRRKNQRNRKNREEQLWNSVHKSLDKLKNTYHQPFILAYPTNKGQVFSGSPAFLEKFKNLFNRDADWNKKIYEDHQALNSGCSENEEGGVSSVDPLFCDQGVCCPPKLPANLDLMVLRELSPWLGKEILKDHWRRGGRRKQIVFGEASFKPSFWPDDIYSWNKIKKHFLKMKKK